MSTSPALESERFHERRPATSGVVRLAHRRGTGRSGGRYFASRHHPPARFPAGREARQRDSESCAPSGVSPRRTSMWMLTCPGRRWRRTEGYVSSEHGRR